MTPIDLDIVPTGIVGPTATTRKRTDRKTYVFLFHALVTVAAVAILVAVQSAIAVFLIALQVVANVLTQVVATVGAIDHTNIVAIDLGEVFAIHVETLVTNICIAFIV
jgi:hypothetical protein